MPESLVLLIPFSLYNNERIVDEFAPPPSSAVVGYTDFFLLLILLVVLRPDFQKGNSKILDEKVFYVHQHTETHPCIEMGSI